MQQQARWARPGSRQALLTRTRSKMAPLASENEPKLRWLVADLNSYFASCEQQQDPRLRGKPVAVAPLIADRTCAIAASYAAKANGSARTNTREAWGSRGQGRAIAGVPPCPTSSQQEYLGKTPNPGQSRLLPRQKQIHIVLVSTLRNQSWPKPVTKRSSHKSCPPTS